MATERVVVERIICDLCGKPTDKAAKRTIGLGNERWELDVCPTDDRELGKAFGEWTKRARPVNRRRRTAKQAVDEWEYLEKQGFTRHRGRKSAAEIAALAKRR